MSPNGREKTGYATRKPVGVPERIVKAHSNPGDHLLDLFAGSRTFGEAAARHGREFVLLDNNPDAIRIMTTRLAKFRPEVENWSETAQVAETQPMLDMANGETK